MSQHPRLLTISALALIVLAVSSPAKGQSTPPEKDTGIVRTQVAIIDLGPEIDGLTGRVLRQNRAIVSPGGATALHDHIERPEIIFVVAGRLIDHQGTVSREYGPGESYTVGKGVSHWLENRGTEPVTLIATFIAKRR